MLLQLYAHAWFKQDPFSLERVVPVENYLDKPEGGLWTSTYNEIYGSDWLKSNTTEIKRGTKGYILEANAYANLIKVDTMQKALEISKGYYIDRFMSKNILDGL